jgi:hypothetical protein
MASDDAPGEDYEPNVCFMENNDAKREANANLIAELRNQAPALLDTIESAQLRVAFLEQVARQATRDGDFAIVWRRDGGYGFGNNWANSEGHARELAEAFAEKHGGWA